MGDYIGAIKGDARSLDYSSHDGYYAGLKTFTYCKGASATMVTMIHILLLVLRLD